MYTLNIYPPEPQISLHFTLLSLIFQIIEVFGFPIGYNGEFQKFAKSRKIKISKIQTSTFVRTTEKKFQENFENIRLRFVGVVRSSLKFLLP